ncbi:MAG: SsrA-binding protein [Phycisphaerae bacterium]|nr:SsrA-binding protein [Phycisphaerae bacterium]|tara:strand:+ start:62 stop:538 length:477 start_codon:yes stop_codon:yes gene_type:complete
MAAKKSKSNKSAEPVIQNRKARHDYLISETLECGIKLTGTEVKSVRQGQISLGEGYVQAVAEPPGLILLGVHIAEYPPAGAATQHVPTRERVLLAHKREIKKWANWTREKGRTIVPLKVYFVDGRIKMLVGLGTGKKQYDKRQAIKARDAQRDMERGR